MTSPRGRVCEGWFLLAPSPRQHRVLGPRFACRTVNIMAWRTCECRVGALLLKGEWQAAVMLIMSPRPTDEMPDISDARARYTVHGAASARRCAQGCRSTLCGTVVIGTVRTAIGMQGSVGPSLGTAVGECSGQHWLDTQLRWRTQVVLLLDMHA